MTATTTKKTRGKQIYCTSTLESTRKKVKVRFSQSPHSHFGEQIQLLNYNFPAIDGATIYVACNGMKTLTANHLNLWEKFTFIKVNSFSIPLNCPVTELMKTRIINLIFAAHEVFGTKVQSWLILARLKHNLTIKGEFSLSLNNQNVSCLSELSTVP